MKPWTITNRVTNEVVYVYTSELPVNWPDYPFAEFNHTAEPEKVESTMLGVSQTFTKLAFERKFSNVEWAAGQTFNASFETIEQLSDEQKLSIRRGLNDYRIAEDISSTDTGVITLLGVYEAFGVIAPGRAREILA